MIKLISRVIKCLNRNSINKLIKLQIVTVILAANLSFLTPFGYQTNLLVMAPGQYKFIDYIKCGIPLTLLSWIIFILFIPRYFNLN